MSKNEALTQITFEALNNEVASEHGVHNGCSGLKTQSWYEIDYDALEKYLIKTYGKAVGTIINDQFDDFDIEEALRTYHFEKSNGNI